jgi:2-oxoglutarate dehydrogenase E1 component
LALPFRKPLVVMSPKSLLRHPRCVSDISELTGKNTFVETYDDPVAKPAKVKRVIFCTGKVYYDLLAKQEDEKREDVAIARVEQLHPFPEDQIRKIISKYKKADVRWVQEESANMGYWDYIMRYMRKDPIELVSRPASASPATGFKKIHDQQQAELINTAFDLKK